MSWSAIFQDAVRRDGRWCYSIVYVNGAKKVLREYLVPGQPDDAGIAAAARAECAALEAAEVSTPPGKFNYRQGDTIDLTPPVEVAPTTSPEEQARAAFFVKWQQYQRYVRAAAAGLIPQTDKRKTELLADLASTWLDTYIDLV